VTNAPVGAPPAAAPLASTAAALTAIQAQLTIWQNKFATTRPLATDPALTALFDATFLADGQNAAAFLVGVTSATQGIPLGFRFDPVIGVNSLDVGAVPNDATHQWFATQVNTGAGNGSVRYFRWLAIKNAAGQWLLAGGQRRVNVGLYTSASMSIPAAIAGGVAPAPVVYAFMNFYLGSTAPGALTPAVNGATLATVSGPGVIGAAPGVLGVATIYSSVATFAGFSVDTCGLNQFNPTAPAITTNCLDLALAVGGGTYSYNIVGTDPVTKAAFNVTYRDLYTAIPPANLTAANFPVINSKNPATLAALLPSAAVTVNWTAPAGQKPVTSVLYGLSTLFASLFNVSLTTPVAVAGATVSSTGALPAIFSAVGTIGQANLQATSVDMNGLYYTTTMSY
jgi:hypothetical protein